MLGRTFECVSPSLLKKRLFVTAVRNAMHIRSDFAPRKYLELPVLSQKLHVMTSFVRRKLNVAFRSAFAEDRRVLRQLLSLEPWLRCHTSRASGPCCWRTVAIDDPGDSIIPHWVE